jgi:hypothetical protein
VAGSDEIGAPQIARLSDEVNLRPHKLVAGHEASVDALEVSRPGTLTVADGGFAARRLCYVGRQNRGLGSCRQTARTCRHPITYGRRQRPAERQLDYVFASHWIADKVKVRGLNSVEEWGASDHCRIEIEADL